MRVARENPTWGYTRLRGALKNLGHELGRNTIKRLLAEHGIAPAPERGKSMSWSTFLKAHWGAIAATDLFTVEVVNPFGLVRYHVLFVIDIATRCVCIGGITSDPNGEWMKQTTKPDSSGARPMDLVERDFNATRPNELWVSDLQGLGNALLEAEECVGSPHGKVRCRKRLGGLLSYYHRDAA